MDERFKDMDLMNVCGDVWNACFQRVPYGYRCSISSPDKDRLELSKRKPTAAMALHEAMELFYGNKQYLNADDLVSCGLVEEEFERRAMQYLDEAHDVESVWENFSSDYRSKVKK